MLRLYQRASNIKVRDAISHEVKLVAKRFVGTAVRNLFDQLAGGLALNYCKYVDSIPECGMPDSTSFQHSTNDFLLFLIGLAIPHSPLEEIVAGLETIDVMLEEEPGLFSVLGYSENVALCTLARFAGFYSSALETVPGPSVDMETSCLWTDSFIEFRMSEPTEDMSAASDEAWDNFVEVTSSVCQSHIYEVDHAQWNEGWVRDEQRLYEEAMIAPVAKKCLEHFEALVASYETSPRPHATSYCAKSNASHEAPPKTPEASPTIAKTKVKVKTRPTRPGSTAAHGHGHENKAAAVQRSDSEQLAASTEPTLKQRFTVKPQTAATLTAIFSKGQGRVDVNWTAFTSAMTDLGFAVIPTKGALVTFAPDVETMPGTRGFGLHRPHNGVLEGFRLMNTARRLTKRYGWTVETFESTKEAAL
ncbi:hypothetical protein MN608_10269 [Microdochium nivale]|nr:hypothetical protein MN608_10269 [Microdochium nivale]